MTRVWSLPLRLLHWALVLAVAAAWADTLWPRGWHQGAGWLAAAAALLRCGWGWAGRGHARFAAFVRPPTAALAHVRALWQGRAPRHLGHNPLGGWMVLALLAHVVALAASGWLRTSDAFWGDATVEAAHHALAWSLLLLVALHVAGVVVTGRIQRENLVLAMFSGRKRDAGPGDVA